MANETALDYPTILADLQGKRNHLQRAVEGLDVAIEALSQLVNGVGGTVTALPTQGKGSVPRTANVRPDTFFRMTVLDAAKKYLGIAGEPRTIQDITDALNAGGLPCKLDSVATIISKAARSGAIEKIGSGQWGLPEWYERKENGGGM